MSAFRAMFEGVRRALRSPFILLWLWLVNFAVALPAALVVADSLDDAIGASRVHEKLRAGFDLEWHGEYADRARGLDKEFSPTVTGAGAFYDNLDGWLDGGIFLHVPGLVAIGAFYALVWALMLGGVLDRYANPAEKPGAGRFFSRGGRYFFRFVRLAVFSGVLYGLVYLLSRRLFKWIEEAARDVTAEVTVFTYSLLIWLLVALLLALIHMSFGYAKIATVVEDRRSMLLAALRGIGFVISYPGKTVGLYCGVALVSALLLGVYAAFAPGPGQSTAYTVALAFGVGQLFLLAKLALRLALYGGQTALYRALTPSGAPRPAPAVRVQDG